MYLSTSKRAVFLTLFWSVLIGQTVDAAPETGTAATVKKTDKEPTCKPERWKKAMEAFERADEKQPPGEGGVVFVGSSSIRLWDLPKSFPNQRVIINRGFGGSEICDSVHYFDTLVTKHRPKVVVLYAGDNDVAGGKKAKQVHADFQGFNKQMSEKLPEAKLIYICIKPSIARWKLAEEMQKANELIAADCKKEPRRLAYIDVWKPMIDEEGEPLRELFVNDGLHLNEKGYELWTSRIRRRLFYWAQ